MANHKLSLEAPDTLNACQLRLLDTSIYNPDMPVKCPQLQVTPPGFSKSVFIDNVIPGFIKNLVACDLGLQKIDCGTNFYSLPDGIYILRYSVSPNDIVYVEYNHLRITAALLKVRNILCDLDISGCQPPEAVSKKMALLAEAREFLYAAKVKVEDCREPSKGMELYKYALSILNKIECKTCK